MRMIDYLQLLTKNIEILHSIEIQLTSNSISPEIVSELIKDVKEHLSKPSKLMQIASDIDLFENNDLILSLLIKFFNGCNKRDSSFLNVINDKIYNALSVMPDIGVLSSTQLLEENSARSPATLEVMTRKQLESGMSTTQNTEIFMKSF